MQAIGESIFDIVYLIVVITLGIKMIRGSHTRRQYLLLGIMAVILGLGDAFHLIPRVLAQCTTGMENYTVALGAGKLITSITMTVFYVILYFAWRERYEEKKRKCLTVTVYTLAIVRIILCLFPQNQWISHNPSLAWGIYRNIPFLLLGIIIVMLFYTKTRKNHDKAFRWMWLTIVISFGCYLPVVLFAGSIPMVGMLMIPKTCAYVWAVLIGYSAMKKEIINEAYENNSYIIRPENKNDFFLVEALIKRAFWNQNVPGCDEHFLAHTMRNHPDFVKELSLVIEDDKMGIVGSVMYAKSKLIDESGREKNILTFGPVAVWPGCQRKGYGKKLLEHSFKIAITLGYDAIVIFGNPDNYVSRGFKSCLKYNVSIDQNIYPSAMLVKELQEGTLAGHKWKYVESDAYKIDMEKFDIFDQAHEKLIPKYKASQEEFYIHSHSYLKP